ncbi:MAG: OmpA family protein [Deltaproteobacteria bacterium]|nr:OmpA family protein [Deltaproteobacteria bacterium]
MKKTVLLVGTILLASCAHSSGTSSQTDGVQNQKQCASEEVVQEAAAIRQRKHIEFMQLKDRYRSAVAYQARWRESFSKINKLVKVALDPDPTAQAEGSVENVIRYDVEYVSGVMHISLQNNQLFEEGKSQLSEMGQEIISSIVQVLSRVDERKIDIGSRTSASNEKIARPTEAKVMALSIERAVKVLEQLREGGIQARNLSAQALAVDGQQAAFENGTTILMIHPSPRELPKYPDQIK